MLKLVGYSRVLKHVVTCRSVIPLCLSSSSSSSSSSMTSQFRNTSFRRVYSTDAEWPRYAHGLFYRLSLFRKLMRESKRIGNRPDIHVVEPYKIKKEDDDHCLYLTISLGQAYYEVSPWDLKVSVDNRTLYIQAKLSSAAYRDGKVIQKYICWVDLPDIDLYDKIFKTSDIKAEYNPHFGLLKITVPKLKEEDFVYNVTCKTTDDNLDLFKQEDFGLNSPNVVS